MNQDDAQTGGSIDVIQLCPAREIFFSHKRAFPLSFFPNDLLTGVKLYLSETCSAVFSISSPENDESVSTKSAPEMSNSRFPVFS